MAFVVLWWVSVFMVILGAPLPGMGMAVAVGLGWLLWRYVPELGDVVEAASDLGEDGDDHDQRWGRGADEEPRDGRHESDGQGEGKNDDDRRGRPHSGDTEMARTPRRQTERRRPQAAHGRAGDVP